MRIGVLACLTVVLTAACSEDPAGVESYDGSLQSGTLQVCYPTEENNFCAGGGSSGGGDPCPGCIGVDAGFFSYEECVAAGQVDQDVDGIADECEYQLANAFKPAFWWDSGDSNLGREPHYAVRTYPDQSMRIFYALAYYRDGGMPITGWEGHAGDSEFIIVDVSFNANLQRWTTNTVFMSAHFRQANDRSRFYAWSELTYDDGHSRGRPRVWAAKEKHSNYATQSGCHFYESCNGLQGGSLMIQRTANLGSSQHKTVDWTYGFYPTGRSSMEGFWSASTFCGWTGQACATTGYGQILRDFGM
jgi:hypothetical protein